MPRPEGLVQVFIVPPTGSHDPAPASPAGLGTDPARQKMEALPSAEMSRVAARASERTVAEPSPTSGLNASMRGRERRLGSSDSRTMRQSRR